jgi:hypothetical protein
VAVLGGGAAAPGSGSMPLCRGSVLGSGSWVVGRGGAGRGVPGVVWSGPVCEAGAVGVGAARPPRNCVGAGSGC